MAGGIREDIARFSVYIVRILAYVVGMLYFCKTIRAGRCEIDAP